MTRRTKSLVCAVVVSLELAATLGAQTYSFRTYGSEAGLANLTVETIVQDRAGFLWVGTQNGLFRFDGRHFLEYSRREGLNHTAVQAIHEDREGRIWVGTLAGLFRVEGRRVVGAEIAPAIQVGGATRAIERAAAISPPASSSQSIASNESAPSGEPAGGAVNP